MKQGLQLALKRARWRIAVGLAMLTAVGWVSYSSFASNIAAQRWSIAQLCESSDAAVVFRQYDLPGDYYCAVNYTSAINNALRTGSLSLLGLLFGVAIFYGVVSLLAPGKHCEGCTKDHQPLSNQRFMSMVLIVGGLMGGALMIVFLMSTH